MKQISIIISDYSVKNQLYNGIVPNANHTITKKLANAIFSHRWEPFKLSGEQFYKVYIEGKHYRAVIQQMNDSDYVLIYFRSKDDINSKNISSYQNTSANKIRSNQIKVFDCIKNKKFKILNYIKQ